MRLAQLAVKAYLLARASARRRRGLDLLVNAAWGGYEQMAEDGRFTWPAPFWEQPLHRWRARTSEPQVRALRAALAMVSLAKLQPPASFSMLVMVERAVRTASAFSKLQEATVALAAAASSPASGRPA